MTAEGGRSNGASPDRVWSNRARSNRARPDCTRPSHSLRGLSGRRATVTCALLLALGLIPLPSRGGRDASAARAQAPLAPVDTPPAPFRLTLPVPPETPPADPGDVTPPSLTWRLPPDWPRFAHHPDRQLVVTRQLPSGDWQSLPARFCPDPAPGQFRELAVQWRERLREPGRLVLDVETSGPQAPANTLLVQLDDRHRNLLVAVSVWRFASRSPDRPGPTTDPAPGPAPRPASSPTRSPEAPPVRERREGELREEGGAWLPVGTGWVLDRTLPGHRLTQTRVDLEPCEPTHLRVELTSDTAADLKLVSIRLARQPRPTQPDTSHPVSLTRHEVAGDRGETQWEFSVGDEAEWLVGAELEIDWSGPAYHPASLAVAESPAGGAERPVAEGALLHLSARDRVLETRQLWFPPVRGRVWKWTVVDRHSPAPLRVTGGRVFTASAWVTVALSDLPQPRPRELTLWLTPGRVAPRTIWSAVPPQFCPPPATWLPTDSFVGNPPASAAATAGASAGTAESARARQQAAAESGAGHSRPDSVAVPWPGARGGGLLLAGVSALLATGALRWWWLRSHRR